MVKQDRSLGMLILLSILTCGIYPYYFWYKMAEDVNIICYGDGEETTGGAAMILLFMFTCGIYPYIWHYKLGNRLQNNAKRYGMDFSESGTTVLLWLILGMFIVIGPYIAVYILIKNTNNLARAYNNGQGRGNQYNGQQNNYMPTGGQNYGGQNYGGQNYSGQNYSEQNYGGQNYGGQNYGSTNEYAQTQPLDQNGQPSYGTVSITCRSGEFAGAVFPLNVNDRILIGRDLSCNIKFASDTPKISRQHCTVEFDGNNVWLTDNNSSFGTYLMDGTKLEPMQRVPLKPGMGFYLGNQNVVFYL